MLYLKWLVGLIAMLLGVFLFADSFKLTDGNQGIYSNVSYRRILIIPVNVDREDFERDILSYADSNQQQALHLRYQLRSNGRCELVNRSLDGISALAALLNSFAVQGRQNAFSYFTDKLGRIVVDDKPRGEYMGVVDFGNRVRLVRNTMVLDGSPTLKQYFLAE